jgi:hypothetical protein
MLFPKVKPLKYLLLRKYGHITRAAVINTGANKGRKGMNNG